MSKPVLTIGICTYNRHAMLMDVVRSVLPQLTASCELLILDNGSDTPVTEVLHATFSADQLQQVKVFRIAVNVGPPLLRLMEACETPWMWGLNEKAVLRPNGVEVVLETIRANEDCIFINFTPYVQERGSASPRRDVALKTKGQLELINGMEDYGSTLDYMANVYHVPSYAKSYGAAYLHGGPGSGQFAVVLHAVGDDKPCLFSEKVPVERPPTDPALRWSQFDYIATYLLPLGLVRTEAGRSKLGDEILEFMPSTKYFVVKFLYLATTNRDLAMYYFKLYRSLLLQSKLRLSSLVLLVAGRLFLYMPQTSLGVLEPMARKLLGRNLKDVL